MLGRVSSRAADNLSSTSGSALQALGKSVLNLLKCLVSQLATAPRRNQLKSHKL